MIRLTRVRTTQAIPSSFRGRTPRTRLLKMMQTARGQIARGEAIKLDFPSRWSVVKDQLLNETHQKCAYCESHTAVVAFGDVEHYRPKSVYWWLAYCYDNYLASCAVCNQRFKGANFEFAGTQQVMPAFDAQTLDADLEALAKTAIPDPLDAAALAVFTKAHKNEQALIVNPYLDEPDEVFGWKALDPIREVEVVPKTDTPLLRRMVDAAERIYGLNRLELRRLRYKQYEFYNLSRQTAESPLYQRSQ